MNLLFLSLAVFFIALFILRCSWNAISRMIPYKDSIIFADGEGDCILVPVYVTRYALGWRKGISLYVGDVLAANIKPGHMIFVPIERGTQRISSQYYLLIERYEKEICISEDIMLFIDADYEKSGGLATPFAKGLEKNSLIDESHTREEYQKALRSAFLNCFTDLKLYIGIVSMLIIGLFGP